MGRLRLPANSPRVVVIGAGQGGLSAAIYARLRGYEVLVLEQQSGAGGKARGIQCDGFNLDPGPSIIILPEIYQDVFRAAGKSPEEYLTFKRLDPITRVHFGGEIVDLPAEEHAILGVLTQRSPEDGASLRSLLEKLDRVEPLIRQSIFQHPIDRVWQLADPKLMRFAAQFPVNKTYKQVIDEWFRDPLLRAFFYGFPSYSGQTYHAKSPSGLLIPYYMIRSGVWYPRGGVRAIPEAMEKLAKELGVEFHFNAKVDRIECDGRAIRAVMCGDNRFEADYVISNVDRLTAESWFGKSPSVDPSLSYFTVHWGIRRELPGLAHHMLLVPDKFEQSFSDLYDRTQFPNPPIVYLNATHVLDSNAAPAGCSNLFGVVTVPAVHSHLDWDALAKEQVPTLRRVLAQHGLGFADNEIVFERVQTPPTFESRDGSYRGSLYGPSDSGRLWGMMPLSNRSERARNLFFAGGSVQPGAGLPMVTLSGKFAAGMLPRLAGS
ncbi:MAG: phytoene desaturase [Armatimonadetes bacterium]|nr:phytoene desaturase [Armatimonadota bacterium]